MKLNTAIWRTVTMMAVGPMTLHAQEVKNTSYEPSEGNRILRFEIELKCSLDKAWELFTTTEGLRTWMAPVVEVDFSTGGRWEVSYDKSKKVGDPGNIINEIVCIVPKEMYVTRVRQVPDNFPFDPELVFQGRSVLQFEEVGENRVKLTLTGTGYGEGPEWDRIYNFGLWGNRVTLRDLHKRIENGPVDWDAEDLSEKTSL